MDTNNIPESQMTVEEVLGRYPEAWVIFTGSNMHCLGCFMQRFCTLQEVAEAYQLPLQKLLDDLEEPSNSNNKNQRSTP